MILLSHMSELIFKLSSFLRDENKQNLYYELTQTNRK